MLNVLSRFKPAVFRSKPALLRWGGLWLAIGCLAVPASAEIYQWRDASGKLHFSDKKPKQQAAEEISAQLGELNMDDSSGERKRLERLFKPETAAEKALHQREAQQQAQREQQHQQRCDKARNYLEALRGRVTFVRDDGSTYTITEAERRQEEAAVQAQIREYCPG